MKTLAELKNECVALGIEVETNGRPSKEPFIVALRQFHWQKDHPDEPLPEQILPMLLGSWEELSETAAQEIERDCHVWMVQPKLDGVRALLHIENGQIRITSRTVSEVTYRLSEFQENVPHLTKGLSSLAGTILDGELVCPVSSVNTGNVIAATALQAATAILASNPENAARIQAENAAGLRFHAFDVLRFRDIDATGLPLIDRMGFLEQAFRRTDNPFIELVPSFFVGKTDIHRRLIDKGEEGTVWKKADEPYEPGRRVKHWLKRKRGIEVEGFVSGFKPGNNGHAGLIGAVEFSVENAGGSHPIGWVSAWTEEARQTMTHVDSDGKVVLNPAYFGRRALIAGQDYAPKSRRLRHARMRRWIAQLP